MFNYKTGYKMENLILSPISLNQLQQLIEGAVNFAISNYDKNRPNQQPQDQLLTQREVAKLLDVSVTSILKWKKEGLLPYHKVKSRIYYNRAEVLKSMASFNQ